jgi:AraC-like DNA-binding protein
MAPNKTIEIDFPVAKINQPTTCLAIEISTDKIKKIAGELNQSAPKDKVFGHWQYDENLIHSHHNSETEALLNRIVKIYTENHQDRSYMIDLAVSELTVRLLRHQSRDFMLSFCQKEPDNNGLNAALSYIYQHISDHLDINHLCRLACMSRTKFFHHFKSHLGCTPIAFQHQVRLKQAANMIKQGQAITKVCFELGFSSASHFSRSFKLFYGLSPREYKIRNSLLAN